MTDKLRTAMEIPDGEILPDEKVIKNDEYYLLSKEAKQLIQIVLNTPKEILGMLPKSRSKSERLTKSKCELYLKIKWSDLKLNKMLTNGLAREVIEEISRWVKTL